VKIAMVDPGAFTLPYDDALCSALVQEGHDIALYTTRFAHGTMPDPQGYKLIEWFYQTRLPGIPRRIQRGVQHPFDMGRLRSHFSKEPPDLVHVQWNVVDRFDSIFWKRLQLPVVYTAHNSISRTKPVNCALLRAFDAVVVHSEYGRQGLRELCRLENVWQVPHGAFGALADEADPVTLPLDLHDGPVVLLAGVLRPYKRIDLLLEAWPQVLDSVPDAQLVVAGRPLGVDLPEIEPPGVKLVPRFLTDAEFSWLIRRSDLVCLPYESIDNSGVVYAALACERPLLLSDVGGFSELRGRGAELVSSLGSNSLGKAIVRILRDSERREELRQEARAAANGIYSWKSIAKTYTQLYAELLNAT